MPSIDKTMVGTAWRYEDMSQFEFRLTAVQRNDSHPSSALLNGLKRQRVVNVRDQVGWFCWVLFTGLWSMVAADGGGGHGLFPQSAGISRTRSVPSHPTGVLLMVYLLARNAIFSAWVRNGVRGSRE